MADSSGGLLLVLALSAVALALALAWQRKALGTQQRAMSQIEESLALSRRGVELGERMDARAEEALRNQGEMLELLRRSAGLRLLHPQ